MKKEDLKAKIKRFEEQRDFELSNGWVTSAYYTEKVINSLKTWL